MTKSAHILAQEEEDLEETTRGVIHDSVPVLIGQLELLFQQVITRIRQDAAVTQATLASEKRQIEAERAALDRERIELALEKEEFLRNVVGKEHARLGRLLSAHSGGVSPPMIATSPSPPAMHISHFPQSNKIEVRSTGSSVREHGMVGYKSSKPPVHEQSIIHSRDSSNLVQDGPGTRMRKELGGSPSRNVFTRLSSVPHIQANSVAYDDVVSSGGHHYHRNGVNTSPMKPSRNSGSMHSRHAPPHQGRSTSRSLQKPTPKRSRTTQKMAHLGDVVVRDTHADCAHINCSQPNTARGETSRAPPTSVSVGGRPQGVVAIWNALDHAGAPLHVSLADVTTFDTFTSDISNKLGISPPAVVLYTLKGDTVNDVQNLIANQHYLVVPGNHVYQVQDGAPAALLHKIITEVQEQLTL